MANGIEGQILAGDKTILDVFGEKSKDADDYFEQLANVVGSIRPTPYHETEEFKQEALDIAEGLAFPGAGIGASIRGGKQALGNVKFLSKYWDMLSKPKKPPIDVAGLSSKSIGKKNIEALDKEFMDAYEEFMKFHTKRGAPKSAWKEVSSKKVSKPDWKELIGKPSKLTPRESANKKHFDEIMDLIDPTKHPEKYEKLNLSPNEIRWLEERKMNKAREALEAIQKKYKIADPDKAEFVDSISALLSKWSKN